MKPLNSKTEAEPLFLNRDQATEYLTRLGIPLGPQALRKHAVHGGGPRIVRFGRRVLYRPTDLAAWCRERLRPDAEDTPVGLPETDRWPSVTQVLWKEDR